MSRIIDDKLYAQLVKILTQDEKVAAFQQLVLAPKAEITDEPKKDTIKSEVE